VRAHVGCSPDWCCSRGWRRGALRSQRRCGGRDQAHHAVEARVGGITKGIVALLAGDLDAVGIHRSPTVVRSSISWRGSARRLECARAAGGERGSAAVATHCKALSSGCVCRRKTEG